MVQEKSVNMFIFLILHEGCFTVYISTGLGKRRVYTHPRTPFKISVPRQGMKLKLAPAMVLGNDGE